MLSFQALPALPDDTTLSPTYGDETAAREGARASAEGLDLKGYLGSPRQGCCAKSPEDVGK